MKPSISVIMPTYNNEKYLEEAILSILNQTYSNFEFIIINDASTDSTSEIVLKYQKLDNRVVLISNDVNIGSGGSRNKGLKVARGEWIARMDGDDTCHPKRFEIQMDCLLNQDIIYLGTGSEIWDKGTGKFVTKFQEPLTHGSIAWKYIYATAFTHASTIGRKDVILKAGGDNSIYRRCQDVDLGRRLIFMGKCANLPDILYTYRKSQAVFTEQTIDIMTTIHQAYLIDMIQRVEQKEVVKDIVFRPQEISTQRMMKIIKILADVFSSLEDRGWLVESDYPYIENQFWKIVQPYPARYQETIINYGGFFYTKLSNEQRDYLYWGSKSWPRIFRYLGLACTSPRFFVNKLLQKAKFR